MNLPKERIYGFDALRTVAMWLGILLHAIIAYKATPESGWPNDPGANSRLLDWIYNFIHSFRMPLFFLIAGFFARMVVLKSGMNYFIQQRFHRIFIPFIVSVVVLVPISMLPFYFNRYYYFRGLSIQEAWGASLAEMMRWNGLAHVWFLYYLMIFYVITVAACFLMKHYTKSKGELFKYDFYRKGWFFVVCSILILSAELKYFNAIYPEVYTGIKPNLFFILYYGFFYCAGWMLQKRMHHVEKLASVGWSFTISGILVSQLMWMSKTDSNPNWVFFLSAVRTVTLIIGMMGLFIRYFNQHSSIWRYCSDASYWVYLVHLSMVAGLQVLLMDIQMPGMIKAMLIIVISLTLSLLSYHYLVRYTFIGKTLHGPRIKTKLKQAEVV